MKVTSRTALLASVWLAPALCAAACGENGAATGTPPGTSPPDARASDDSWADAAPGAFASDAAPDVFASDAPTSDPFEATSPEGACRAIVQEHPIEGANHVPECSYVSYGTLPPSSGNHYPVWAAFKTYSLPVPEGYWVHDLEHGAIVLTYDCGEAGCAADVAAAQAFIDAYPVDPLCTPLNSGAPNRLVMTPDPRLDVRFAASAWGWTLRADCFDPVVFKAFADAHYGQGPEELCNAGEDVVGSTGAPASCGVDP
jgi:hypothetical protein